MHALWGAGADDVWALPSDSLGGVNEPMHWDGHAWTKRPLSSVTVPGQPEPSSLDVKDLWGGGPADVWAFGAVITEDVQPTFTSYKATRRRALEWQRLDAAERPQRSEAGEPNADGQLGIVRQ